jgi:hypothetical protein
VRPDVGAHLATGEEPDKGCHAVAIHSAFKVRSAQDCLRVGGMPRSVQALIRTG